MVENVKLIIDWFIDSIIRWKCCWYIYWGRTVESLVGLIKHWNALAICRRLYKGSFLFFVAWGVVSSQSLGYLCHGLGMYKAVCYENSNNEYQKVPRLPGSGIEVNKLWLYPWDVLYSVPFASSRQLRKH